ncbi:hypothetical protein DAPPUDRAFT_309229 [Daphnia pulex]|uniref:Uncharacterized protein n=1 Tax=Daphnia pulex TaxID=6669 RepID=E9HB59_DAPPU|nr:hypothetical protein DAPPUDRAFT_309229 [Daphnia pulex]|eukprot:EFX71069.1 hypothetical protein DAPPUDRAFT_309229 [Daphnia pulex]
MASSSGTGRETTKPALENEVGFLSPEANRLSDISSNNGEEAHATLQDISASPTVKRRPGRPRLRPVGPAHQGNRKSKSEGSAKKTRRGAPSGPRVIKPLPVPIGLMTTKNSEVTRTPMTPTSSTPIANSRPSSYLHDSLSP